jgi:predicted acylesterase/phospholipase RssA
MSDDHETYNKPIKTVFFETARAVFQGGGCRGTALVGAYEACLRAGVNFSEVAGTSAGAIIAALIGAGASPEFLREKLNNLDYKSFLGKPEKNNDGIKEKFWRIVSFLLKLTKYKMLTKLVLHGGFYSSLPIENWMRNTLRELRPDVQHPIHFKDLKIPTRIVATDLSACREQVWGTKETPNEDVAFAVRASCSIPFFFQPVIKGQSRYVDGGILSNLPAFVYTNGKTAHSFANRILAFRLIEENENVVSWDPVIISRKLIGAIIDGATELQVSLKGSVYTIDIKTTNIKATDFDKMTPEIKDNLFDAGKRSTENFIKNEALYVNKDEGDCNILFDKEEAFSVFVEEAETAPSEIIISDNNTEWFWKLFPTILSWRLKDINVRVIVPENEICRDTKEDQRRVLLTKLGVILEKKKNVPFGFIITRLDPTRSTAVIYNKTEDIYTPYATRYSGICHQDAINALRKEYNISTGGSSIHKIDLQTTEDYSQVISRLKRGVSQYDKKDIDIELKEIDISKIKILTCSIRAYKYKQILRLVEIYKDKELALFRPINVIFHDDTTSIILPPVVECHGERYISIEGNTRAYYCWRNKIKKMFCFVVHNATSPLPAEPIDFDWAQISERKLEPNERMHNWNRDNFRRIEGAVRP